MSDHKFYCTNSLIPFLYTYKLVSLSRQLHILYIFSSDDPLIKYSHIKIQVKLFFIIANSCNTKSLVIKLILIIFRLLINDIYQMIIIFYLIMIRKVILFDEINYLSQFARAIKLFNRPFD